MSQNLLPTMHVYNGPGRGPAPSSSTVKVSQASQHTASSKNASAKRDLAKFNQRSQNDEGKGRAVEQDRPSRPSVSPEVSIWMPKKNTKKLKKPSYQEIDEFDDLPDINVPNKVAARESIPQDDEDEDDLPAPLDLGDGTQEVSKRAKADRPKAS